MHPDYDAGSPLLASMAPGAFPSTHAPNADPQVALLLPYGEAMAEQSALINVSRNQGIMRDIPLRESVGDWEIPLLPLRAAPGCE